MPRRALTPAVVGVFVAGAAAALGQAPFGLWVVTLVALAVVLRLLAKADSARRALLLGLVAGTGYFAVALQWIVEPFLVDVATHGWMAPFALVLMAVGMALFWAVPAALAWAATRTRPWRLAALAVALLAGEVVRGIVFTGFPWAMLGHVLIDTPMAQAAALGGAPLLSSLVLATAALLALATMGRQRALVALPLALVLLAGPWAWGAARLSGPEMGSGIRVRIVQANIPQHLKWQPDLVRDHFLSHLDLSRGEAPVDLVLWPETAAPFFLDAPGEGLAAIAEAAQAPVLLGIDRRGRSDSGAVQYFNSAAFLDAAGQVTAVYDKHHLVPFGEYIPVVGTWADAAGIAGLAARLFTGYTPGPGPAVIDLGPLGQVLPLICYEAIFPRNLRTETRPDWIAHLTNDAWFGARMGPQQHLAQTRLRAIEFGLPIVRAANTGISAVIDPYGWAVDSLPLDTRGALVAEIPAALPPTPYARWGEWPWLLWAMGVVLLLVARVLRVRRA